MKVLLDLTRLVREGKLSAGQAAELQALASRDTGSLAINIGKRLASGDWLEITGTGPFTLALTLYDTAVFSGFSSDQSMPSIQRGKCA